MKVREVMTSTVLSVSPSTAVADVRRLLQQRSIRHILVTDGPQLLGIATDRDIRLNLPSPATTLSVWEMNSLLAKLTVGEIMTRDVVTIAPDHEVHEAAQLMIDRRIGALPVIADRKVVGIITETDLLRALIVLREQIAPTRPSG
jgi:acetoin utilization protein AcuB